MAATRFQVQQSILERIAALAAAYASLDHCN